MTHSVAYRAILSFKVTSLHPYCVQNKLVSSESGTGHYMHRSIITQLQNACIAVLSFSFLSLPICWGSLSLRSHLSILNRFYLYQTVLRSWIYVWVYINRPIISKHCTIRFTQCVQCEKQGEAKPNQNRNQTVCFTIEILSCAHHSNTVTCIIIVIIIIICVHVYFCIANVRSDCAILDPVAAPVSGEHGIIFRF